MKGNEKKKNVEAVVFQKREKPFYDIYTFWKVELEKNIFLVNRSKKVNTRDKLKKLTFKCSQRDGKLTLFRRFELRPHSTECF